MTLHMLHAPGIGAAGRGVDQFGRPAPDIDGCPGLNAQVEDGMAAAVERMTRVVGDETVVRIVSFSDAAHEEEVRAVMEREPCWVWAPDVRQAVLPNWPGEEGPRS